MDTKKVLLGSTAIVGAGILLANPAPAQAQIEVTLSGYTEFGSKWSQEDDVLPSPGGNNNFIFFMDNEVFVRAEATDDATGTTYGSKVELEVGSGDTGNNAFVDEVIVFFSGAFGRVELGKEDGAADVMMLDAASVAAGTGGIDGDLTPINLTTGQIADSSDAAKVTYFTPRVGGFQAGVSYVPDSDGAGGAPFDADHFFEAGVNFVGQFAGVDLGIAAVGTINEGVDDFDEASWAVGGTFGLFGLNFGASYGNEEILFEGNFITAGVGFGLGPANASFNYEYVDVDDDEDVHLFVLSADVGLMPGVVLKGDVGHRTDEAEEAFENDDGWAGVLTVQLNY